MALTYLGYQFIEGTSGNLAIPADTDLVVLACYYQGTTRTIGGTSMTKVGNNTHGAFFILQNPPTGTVAYTSSTADKRVYFYFKGAGGVGTPSCVEGNDIKTATINLDDLGSYVLFYNFIGTSDNTMTVSNTGYTRTSVYNSLNNIYYGYGVPTSLTCTNTSNNSDAGDWVSVGLIEVLEKQYSGVTGVFLSDYGVM